MIDVSFVSDAPLCRTGPDGYEVWVCSVEDDAAYHAAAGGDGLYYDNVDPPAVIEIMCPTEKLETPVTYWASHPDTGWFETSLTLGQFTLLMHSAFEEGLEVRVCLPSPTSPHWYGQGNE